MSVSVIYRPQGVTISEIGVQATISQSYPTTSAAAINMSGHGLSPGSWVFIKSQVENYNGFFKVFVVNANLFTLIDDHGDIVQYIIEANITYYPQTGLHEWSAAFNPIVYALKTTKWPKNSDNAIVPISSFSNSNGSMQITATGSLGGFATLDYIQIFGTNYDGVYQITNKVSSSVVVIDLAYSSSFIGGGSIQLYYHNYNTVVNIYVGLSLSHYWNSLKPISKVGTIRLIPDQNNEVKFSIHEYVKASINQRNGTLLATLPNNIDFMTQFYIEYADSFDSVVGGKLVQFDSNYVSDGDTFIGGAINAKLPFKNRYSGFMTEYLTKFLTVFDTPVMFAGCSDIDDCYFDLSFFEGGFVNQVLKQQWYRDGVLLETTGKPFVRTGGGVYRLQPDQNCSYDRVDVTIVNSLIQVEDLDQWVNDNTGPGPSWAAGSSTPNVTIPGLVGTTTDEITTAAVAYTPGAYIFPYSLFVGNGNTSVRIIVHIKGYRSGVPIGDGSITRTITNPTELIDNAPISVTFSDVPDKIAMYIFIDAVSGGGNTYAELRSFSHLEIPTTETKTITIKCNCAEQNGPFTPFYLTWLNNLGGFEYWKFEAFNDNMILIGETGETSQNTFPNWPYSYGEFADTEKRRQTFRESTKQFVVRSQELVSKSQIESLATIKESTLVQIINSRYDKRTVIVDSNSFTIYKDSEKAFNISFTITYTDDIPSQTL